MKMAIQIVLYYEYCFQTHKGCQDVKWNAMFR